MSDILKNFDTNDPDEISQKALDMAAKMMGPSQNAPTIVQPDDEFEFECQQCGACCIGRSDIILNPFDIYTASKHLGIKCHEFINKYTARILGGDSKVPIVTLKPNDDNGFCPFLVFDYMNDGKFKCSINDAKPGACRTHPLGIMSQCDIKKDGKISSIKTHIIKVDQCEQSKVGKYQNVRDWMKYYYDHETESLKAHELAIMSDSIISWRKFFFMTTVFALSAEKNGVNISNEMMTQGFNILASTLIEFGYSHYDTNKPFLEQCDDNYKFLKERFVNVSHTLIPCLEQMFKITCNATIDEAMEIAAKNGLDNTIEEFGMKRCTYKGVSTDGLFDEGNEDDG